MSLLHSATHSGVKKKKFLEGSDGVILPHGDKSHQKVSGGFLVCRRVICRRVWVCDYYVVTMVYKGGGVSLFWGCHIIIYISVSLDSHGR
jgi:hypothetical protein